MLALKSKFLKRAASIFLSVAMVISGMAGVTTVQKTDNTSYAAPVLAQVPIYRDYENYSFAERAADMVARMTLAQKASRLVSQSSPAIAAGNDDQGTLGTGVKVYTWWAEALHGYNDAGGGGNTANSTSYPLSYAIGQSWDPKLAWEVSSSISDEIREKTREFSLMLNYYSPVVMEPLRDPRWGRNTEGLGEDPVHAAIMGAQYFNGFQGFQMDGKTLIDPNGYWKANNTAKHYLANDSEVNRLQGVANLTEQEHREYYGYSYRELMKRSVPASVMSSYNRVQIKYAAYSPFLEMPQGINHYTLDTLLRQTYGFKGYVTSDCDSLAVSGGSGNTGQTGATREGQGIDSYGENWGHQWRSPSFRWYGATANTQNAMTAGISNAQLAAWGIMGGAELECSGGVMGGTHYSTQTPVTDANVQNAITTPLGRFTESTLDVAAAELMEARLRVGEWDSKKDYMAAPSVAGSTGRVSWYDKAMQNVLGYGLALPAANGSIAATDLTMTADRMKLAGRAAGDSLVLLKNEKVDNGKPILPLTLPDDGKSYVVGVYGNLRTNNVLGQYSSGRSGNGLTKQLNPVNGIREALTAKYGNRITVVDRGLTATPDPADDYRIAVVGDTTNGSLAAEQYDRRYNGLGLGTNGNPQTTSDITIIKNLYNNDKKLIVVMITSGTVGEITTATTVDNVFDHIPALLHATYLGDRPGEGIGKVISGAVNPSAHTVQTFYPLSSHYGSPQALGNEAGSNLRDNWGSLNQIRSYRLSAGMDGPWQSPYPTAANPSNMVPANGVTYNPNGPNLGRTYMYYTGEGNKAVLFPFGFGLSYTTFTYGEPVYKVNGQVKSGTDAITVQPNDKIEVTFKVTNTGTVAGREVAQFYVRTPNDIVNKSDKGSFGQAYSFKRLKDFAKTNLLVPGESETVTLSVNVPDIAFWVNANKKFELIQGTGNYTLQVARSSADSLEYQGEQLGAVLSRDMRIGGATDANGVITDWNPKVSVLSFKANGVNTTSKDPAEVKNDPVNGIPQRLLYHVGDKVLPNPTVCMDDDTLYGTINRLYSSSPDDQMYPIPSNIKMTYTVNRKGIVEVNEDGTLSALGGGVVTVTGTATDSITGSSASSEFVVYVQGAPAGADCSISSFKFNGEDFEAEEGVKSYDVYVPDSISNIVFTSANVTASSPAGVEVSVALNPSNGAVSPGNPCVATVTVSSKEVMWKETYTINFGRMSITWRPDLNYMGYNTYADVRFSDGKTKFIPLQGWYDLDSGKMTNLATSNLNNETTPRPAIPKHGSGTLNVALVPESGDFWPQEWLAAKTMTKFVFDENFVPLTQAVSTDWVPPVLTDLRVAGTSIPDFDPDKLVYDYAIPFGSGVAQAQVTASFDTGKAAATIVQATGVPGSATVTLTSLSGTATNLYRINFTQGPNPNRATAPKTTPANWQDPDDAAWAAAQEISVDKRTTQNASTTMQASGKAKLLWDDTYLYARVEVVKNYALSGTSGNAHERDSVELFLSEENFRGSYSGTQGNQYRVNYMGETSQKTAHTGWGGTGKDISSTLPDGQWGYVLTYRIPYRTAAVAKAPGTVFGLDLQINAMQNATTRTCFTWSDGTANGYNSSTLWGELVLGN